MQPAYATPPLDESRSTTFFGSVLLYVGDMVVQEPSLIEMYGAILPKLDAILGGEKKSPGNETKAPGEQTNAVGDAKK